MGQFYQRFQEIADSDLTTAAPHAYDSSRDYGKYPTFAPLKWKPPVAAPEQKPDIVQITPSPKKTDWKHNVLRNDEVPTGIYQVHEIKARYVFGSRYRREQIKSVTFLNTLREMPSDAWDVSESGNLSVMAWVKPNCEQYDLFIGAEGGMRTGKNCESLFAGYVNVERITFGRVLHTECAERMCDMFGYCASLTELDLSSFDTSGVWDMSYMFAGCKSLTGLDLSNFDTAEVQDMSYMFEGCASLTKLDLSSFDTYSVVYMGYMFEGCASLTKLDLSSFDTPYVKDMSHMFSDCKSLTELGLSSFDTSNVEEMSNMFDCCPAGSKWEHLLD